VTIPTQDELDRLVKYFSDTQSAAFSQTAAYTNLTIGAGYAGAFALWNIVKGTLTPTASNWIVLLLGVSLVTFISWNTFQMIWFALERLKYHDKLKGIVGVAIIGAYQDLESQTRRKLENQYLPLWVVVVTVCISTASIGMSVLLFNCAAFLLK
jgi:hypothetical protein